MPDQLNVGAIVRFRDPDHAAGKSLFGHIVAVHRGPLSTKVSVTVAGRDHDPYVLGADAVTVLRQPQAGRTVLVASLAIATMAALVVLFAARVSAQPITGPVSYEVGNVLIFASRTRNDPSCSVTRNVRNTGSVPVQVLGSASWDGQPDHLPPNQGQFRTGATIQPGEQATATWTNHGYVTDGPLFLTWSVIDPQDPDPLSVGHNHLEPVPACETDPPPSSSVPTTTPSDTSTTVATVVPDPVEPTVTAPGPETTTTIPTEVLTSSIARIARAELPATGLSPRLADVGILLVGFGLAVLLAGRRAKAGQS